MGLFSRKKKQTVQGVQEAERHAELVQDEPRQAGAPQDDAEVAAPAADDAQEPADAVSDDATADDATTDDPETDDPETDSVRESTAAAPVAGGDVEGADPLPARGEHLEDGPYDESAAPEEDRIDLGGLQVPTVDGMELRMEVDQRSGAVTGANLVIGGSSLQVQAFAAPKSRGLWEDVRTSLRDSVVKQGGTAETRAGVFGTELITRLPVKRADGRTGYRPARFIGIDGPRWFLRAILTGKALGDKEQSQRFETLISRLVVVRGSEAMAPQELLPLRLPGERPGFGQLHSGPMDPLARGPEITEVG